MMRLIPKTNIDFVGKRFIFFTLSAILLIGSIICIAVKGFNYGLDFTGGTLVQVDFQGKIIETDELRNVIEAVDDKADIQSHVGSNSFTIKVQGNNEGNSREIEESIKTAISKLNEPYVVERVDFVGPAVGRDLSRKAMWAIIFSMLGMIIYIAFRFSNPIWGLMGVIALGHDILFTLGVLSLTGREMNLVTVAALLTIAGYSINDTIVIFDRMRENIYLNVKMKFKDLLNLSVNETLSRTIITSTTVFTAVLFLYIMGGEVLNTFAFTMLIGVIVGVYSTLGVATALLYQWIDGGRDIILEAEEAPKKESNNVATSRPNPYAEQIMAKQKAEQAMARPNRRKKRK